MDKVVHGDKPLGGVDEVSVVVPAVNEDGHVMIPVEEDELLLAEDDEVSVHELGALGKAEKEGPEAITAFTHYFVADAPFPAVGNQVLHMLHPLGHETTYAEQGQEQTPAKQRHAEFVPFPVLHPVLQPEYGHHVDGRDVEGVVPIVSHKIHRFLTVESALYAIDQIHFFFFNFTFCFRHSSSLGYTYNRVTFRSPEPLVPRYEVYTTTVNKKVRAYYWMSLCCSIYINVRSKLFV